MEALIGPTKAECETKVVPNLHKYNEWCYQADADFSHAQNCSAPQFFRDEITSFSIVC